MAIKDVELFHGAVLAKLMRNHRPVALSMIETRPKEGYFYTINIDSTEAEFYIKHRTVTRKSKDKGQSISWYFNFTSDEIKKLREVKENRGRVYVALVCALIKGNHGEKMQIAFFDPDNNKSIENVIDFESNSGQSFTVKDNLSGMLVVSRNQQEVMKLSRGALDKWPSTE